MVSQGVVCTTCEGPVVILNLVFEVRGLPVWELVEDQGTDDFDVDRLFNCYIPSSRET